MNDSIRVEGLSKRYRVRRRGPAQPWWRRLADLVPRRGEAPDRGRAVREIWALRNVSFSVEPGTILGVIGPNGAGKTTLLKVLARVTLPTEGRVVGRGRVISLLEVGAGFQPELSGRDNVYLNAALYGIPRGEVERRFDDIVEWAGLAEFIDLPVKHYSSGMYLRLAFSVAINLEPDILLADEVLAVGDLAFQERCIQRVQEAGAAGRTVVFVSHDLAAIARLCQRVIWLDAGRIVAEGEPREVVARYEQAATHAPAAEQDEAADLAGTEEGRVISTRLLSSGGQEVSAVRASDQLEVEVTFRTSAVGARARCVFDVYSDNVLAFTSKQRPAMDIPRPGLYGARVRIPGDLLAEALYTVKLEVGIGRAGTEHFLPGARAVSFRVYEPSGGAPGNRNNRARAGVVAPRLEWQASAEGVLVGS